jgi:gliding motility-associated lipoprotein GldH
LKPYYFILTLIGLFAISCNENVLLDEHTSIKESGWQYHDSLHYTFEVTQKDHYHQLFANLRINSDYPYANLHLKLNITFPDSTQKEYKVPVQLAEKSGKWIGSGLGDIITLQAPILHRKLLNQKGKYHISVTQDMRLETLFHIVSAGIKVEQQEEIF